MKPIQCRSDDPRPEVVAKIRANIETHGYAILAPEENSEAEYLSIADWFGPIQSHERARDGGIVDVTSDPALAPQKSEEFKGLGTSRFEPHTDGAFLDAICQDEYGRIEHIAPPTNLLLRTIRRPASGGKSLLIDGQAILRDILQNEPEILSILCSPFFHFVRPKPSKLFPTQRPVFSRLPSGKILCRFRASPLIARGIDIDDREVARVYQHFTQNYVFNDDYEIRFMLEEGHILAVDNFRMLHGRTEFDTAGGSKHRHLTRVWIADHKSRNRIDAGSELTMSADRNQHIEQRMVFLPKGNPIINSYATLGEQNTQRVFDSTSLGITLDTEGLEKLNSYLGAKRAN